MTVLAVAWREVDYTASGAVIASNDPAAVDELFGYTARDFDTAVGLQYNRARWYDPNTGRWLSQDPIGFAAGDANLYRYVGNHPTMATDPSGLVEPGIPIFGIPFFPVITMGGTNRLREHGNAVVHETRTVWNNTEHLPLSQRVYVTGGTTIATEVGVRGVSDAFSPHDAVDAHLQSAWERTFDGVTGSVQLVTTACGTREFLPIGRGRFLPMTRGGDGFDYALEVLEGGSGCAFAGHGRIVKANGTTIIPEGTSLTIVRPGVSITEPVGQLLEMGDWDGLIALAKRNPRVAKDLEGMVTQLPGKEVPNLICAAPDKLTVFRKSTTVEDPTSLRDLLKENMGNRVWAASTEYKLQ